MRLIIISLFLLASTFSMAQKKEKAISFSTNIGGGLAMSQPSKSPLVWDLTGHYAISSKFSVGAGMGISSYEKILLPIYGNVKYLLRKPQKYTPYISCNVGYSFVLAKKANGGFYLQPSIGIQLKITSKMNLQLALGYELQELERLKKHTDKYFETEFEEKLSYHSVIGKVGITF